ncbi:MAG: type II toxin-antitoxin system mRNA interferase toxin, RelE/StbE family [bacterium]|nr:type II toxin-antitoxin system mRNA interferase toxin, RelE/StbE family [bacterium]
MNIKFAKKFEKQFNRASKDIQKAFHKRLDIFISDPFHSQLHNHQLTGKYKGYRSINITGDWRAIYCEIKDSDGVIIIFEVLGTHSQLYR